jgi:hypothetical protein
MVPKASDHVVNVKENHLTLTKPNQGILLAFFEASSLISRYAMGLGTQWRPV